MSMRKASGKVGQTGRCSRHGSLGEQAVQNSTFKFGVQTGCSFYSRKPRSSSSDREADYSNVLNVLNVSNVLKTK